MCEMSGLCEKTFIIIIIVYIERVSAKRNVRFIESQIFQI